MHELEILSRLTKAESDLPGKRIVQNLLDSFTISGPNGTHRCLIADAARLNLNEVKEYIDSFIFLLPEPLPHSLYSECNSFILRALFMGVS